MKKSDTKEPLTEEERIKAVKNKRARDKARAQREKMKQVQKQKETLEYQRKINVTRKNYNLKPVKVQPKLQKFFTSIKKSKVTPKSENG